MKGRRKRDDEQLLVAAAQKNLRRFADLYELHFHKVYAFVFARVANRPAAEDLTSHVFQQALAKLNEFQWRGAPFSSWLFRIAANAMADHFRRKTGERTVEQTADPPESDSASHEPHGEAAVEQAARRGKLFSLVAALPAEQRRVIEMRFAEEKSIRDIARALRRTEGAVKQLQFRALENLRARMRDADG